jgi:hypothetical protein
MARQEHFRLFLPSSWHSYLTGIFVPSVEQGP